MRLIDFLLGYRNRPQWSLDKAHLQKDLREELKIAKFQHKKSSAHLFHLRKEESLSETLARQARVREANLSANC
jgi:hypothetical protein